MCVFICIVCVFSRDVICFATSLFPSFSSYRHDRRIFWWISGVDFFCMFCIFCVIWNWSTIHSSRQLEDDLRSLEAQISIYNASFIEERKERNKLFGVGGVCADADDHFNNNNNNSKKKKRRWKTA